MKLFTAILLIGIAPGFASAQLRGNEAPSMPMQTQQTFSEQRSTQFTPQQSSFQAERPQPMMNNAPSMQFTPQQSSFQPQQTSFQSEQTQPVMSNGPATSDVSSYQPTEERSEASRWLPENDLATPTKKFQPLVRQHELSPAKAAMRQGDTLETPARVRRAATAAGWPN